MTDDGQFRFAETHFEVDHSRLTFSDLRDRQPFNGEHLWTVGFFFALADPEAALDDMVCDHENLATVSPIACAWCFEPYRSPGILNSAKCLRNQPE